MCLVRSGLILFHFSQIWSYLPLFQSYAKSWSYLTSFQLYTLSNLVHFIVCLIRSGLILLRFGCTHCQIWSYFTSTQLKFFFFPPLMGKPSFASFNTVIGKPRFAHGWPFTAKAKDTHSHAFTIWWAHDYLTLFHPQPSVCSWTSLHPEVFIDKLWPVHGKGIFTSDNRYFTSDNTKLSL